MMIGQHDTSKKTYVIAEAGTSHMGKVKLALQYVLAAKNANADAIKFQMFTPREELFCPLEGDENRWAWWNQSMLRFAQWKRVKEYADELDIHFLASVFQHTGLKWMKKLQPPAWKVASRAINRFPFESGSLYLISCGMGTPYARPEPGTYLLLDCVSEYPTQLKHARMSSSYAGLSDHSGTIYPALEAMARGAEVIEVHMKLDDIGPDATSALHPYDIKQITGARDGFAEMRAG